ncbi:MAG: L,D-transpeptidase family protein [Phycisphaerae bacterium]|nr:L,D-transpeptidase family protein [Phycisphaerae bacterium]
MARRKLRKFWARPANKFLASLVAFVLCSWLVYQGLSWAVGPMPADQGARRLELADGGDYDTLVVERVPLASRSEAPAAPVTGGLPLLAADPAPSAAEPAPSETKTPEPLEAKAAAALAEAEQLIRSRKTVKARSLLNEFLTANGYDEPNTAVERLALELGEQSILTPGLAPDDHLCYPYTVKSGDLLMRIANPCHVPYRFICRINGIADPRQLRVDQRLKLVRGPINAVVVKHKFMMYMYLQDAVFARYAVGLGKNDKTPTGTWLVEDCVKNPAYTDPDTGKLYAGADPENPTGGYWVRLKGLTGEAVGKSGFGIHGTIEPESIGKMMSKGCVRLHKKDIAEVFDMLESGASKITVLP